MSSVHLIFSCSYSYCTRNRLLAVCLDLWMFQKRACWCLYMVYFHGPALSYSIGLHTVTDLCLHIHLLRVYGFVLPFTSLCICTWHGELDIKYRNFPPLAHYHQHWIARAMNQVWAKVRQLLQPSQLLFYPFLSCPNTNFTVFAAIKNWAYACKGRVVVLLISNSIFHWRR